MSRAGHLTTRFFGSLRARPPDAADIAWVHMQLSEIEFACWSTMGQADRAESVDVARRVAAELGRDADPRWLAAALLHDVGKSECGLGTFRRAGATAIAAVVSHGRARTWPNAVGRYMNHDELGAARLKAIGARPEVTAWAAAHHRPEQWARTGIPPEICDILARADGETPRK